jgi:hypothetical protein
VGGVFSFCAFVAALFFVGAVMNGNGRKAGICAAIFVVCSIGVINLGGDFSSTSFDDCTRFSSFANSCD